MKAHISKMIAIIFCIILSLHYTTLPDIVAGTTILTPHGLVPIENIATGDYLISYTTNKSTAPSHVVSITTLTTDLMLAIEIDHTILYASPDQLFYDPYVGISFFFGSGVEFGGLSLAATLLGSTAIGITLFNKHKKNAASFDKEAQNYSQNSGSFNHDPDDDKDKNNYKQKENTFFETIKSISDKKARTQRFGNFYRDPETKLWWSRDRANHGGSAYKVFKETTKGLEWIFDANALGKPIIEKHKGPIGLFISNKDLIICP